MFLLCEIGICVLLVGVLCYKARAATTPTNDKHPTIRNAPKTIYGIIIAPKYSDWLFWKRRGLYLIFDIFFLYHLCCGGFGIWKCHTKHPIGLRQHLRKYAVVYVAWMSSLLILGPNRWAKCIAKRFVRWGRAIVCVIYPGDEHPMCECHKLNIYEEIIEE